VDDRSHFSQFCTLRSYCLCRAELNPPFDISYQLNKAITHNLATIWEYKVWRHHSKNVSQWEMFVPFWMVENMQTHVCAWLLICIFTESYFALYKSIVTNACFSLAAFSQNSAYKLSIRWITSVCPRIPRTTISSLSITNIRLPINPSLHLFICWSFVLHNSVIVGNHNEISELFVILSQSVIHPIIQLNWSVLLPVKCRERVPLYDPVIFQTSRGSLSLWGELS